MVLHEPGWQALSDDGVRRAVHDSRGRRQGEALFGDSLGIARGAYERTLIGDGYPAAYIEFPLLGSPGFDLLSVHSAVRPGSRFAPGAGFGYQAMLDWFSGICEKGTNASCGIELDTSVGETERAAGSRSPTTWGTAASAPTPCTPT